MTNRLRAFIISLIGFVLVLLIFFVILKEDEQTRINFFSLCGTYASFVGIIITYLQISSVRESSTNTNIAVEKSLARANQILSIADISKAVKTIHEVVGYLRDNKYELAALRMVDLKSILIQVEYNEDLFELTKSKTYSKLIITIGVDINSLNSILIEKREGTDIVKITENLSKIENVLTKFENKLKFSKNDT